MSEITNEQFRRDPFFIAACTEAKVQPTKRQASKFRRRKGRAYAARKGAANGN